MTAVVAFGAPHFCEVFFSGDVMLWVDHILFYLRSHKNGVVATHPIAQDRLVFVDEANSVLELDSLRVLQRPVLDVDIAIEHFLETWQR